MAQRNSLSALRTVSTLGISRRERDRHAAKVLRAEKAAERAARIAVLAARWLRKSRGTLTPKQARELAELSDGYRGGFWAPDFVGQREPGVFAREWAFARSCLRPEIAIANLASRGRDLFCKYGPTGGSAGLWPGDRLVWDPSVPPTFSHSTPGAWVVQRGNG